MSLFYLDFLFLFVKKIIIDMKNTTLYLKYYRTSRKLTQNEMADLLKMSQRNYSKIENGEISLTLARLEQIAKILNVSEEEIIGFEKGHFQNNDISQDEKALYAKIIGRLEDEVNYLRQLVNTIKK